MSEHKDNWLSTMREATYGIAPGGYDVVARYPEHKCWACGEPASKTYTVENVLRLRGHEIPFKISGMWLCEKCSEVGGTIKEETNG